MHKSFIKAEEAQKQLNKLLKDLAVCKDDIALKGIEEQIYDFYVKNCNFRHRYSDFLPLILEVAKDEVTQKYDIERIDPFGENLQTFMKYVKNKDGISDDVLKSVFKLTDHINLEIGRFKESLTKETRIIDLEKQNQKTTLALNEATKKLNMATKRLNSVQTELIAVLSIFAAIVLTFSGSMSLIGNALSNVEKAPLFKSIFFIALCGFIVLNLIFLMMYIVGKITDRNIYAHCKTDYCTCGENNMPACNGFNRIRKRLPYIFWTNTILLIIIIIGFILSLRPSIIYFIY